MPVVKNYTAYIMACLYIVAGILHFTHTNMYENVVPTWLPARIFWVYITGILEIFFGVLVFFNRTRRLAAWGIIVLLILVFPANVQMLLNYIDQEHPQTWIAWLRLPLQLLLIVWAFLYTRPAKDEKRHTT